MLSYEVSFHCIFPARAGGHVRRTPGAPGHAASRSRRVKLLLVDSAARRLYISRSNHLLVLDIDSGRQLADIIDLPSIACNRCCSRH